MGHLSQVSGGWIRRGPYGKLADHARDKGWWDLWAALVRTCSGPKEFNREISVLLDEQSLPESDVISRLLALAGVSREWNWPGCCSSGPPPFTWLIPRAWPTWWRLRRFM